MAKNLTGNTEILFVSVGGKLVKGRVIQIVQKKLGRSYAVVEYRAKLPCGRKSPPLRECFPIVNGQYMDIVARRNA